MKNDPWVARWYRRILRLYPRSLRREHGDEMVEVVCRRWQEARAGSAGRSLAFHLRTWTDAVVQGAVAWIERGIGLLEGLGHELGPRLVGVERRRTDG